MVRAVFVPLRRLQKELDQAGRINTILTSNASLPVLEKALRDKFSLEDLGIKLRPLEKQDCFSLESESILVSDALASTARATATRLGMRSSGVLAYLANTIRAGERQVPYSLVAAIEESASQRRGVQPAPSTIVLND